MFAGYFYHILMGFFIINFEQVWLAAMPAGWVRIPLMCFAGFWDLSLLQASRWLSGRNRKIMPSDQHRLSNAISSSVAQSWPWGSQNLRRIAKMLQSWLTKFHRIYLCSCYFSWSYHQHYFDTIILKSLFDTWNSEIILY